ncbi:SprB repeat-containing protein [Flavihumibacter sp. ZG627]|uniref:immunoglobulin domain-containing protein n=1 Tax=Flavihumibacter sp. ZG627 TaxID=1463156 RepID=UPI00057DFBC2|nr:SprB repeat-containing protein [Flavihumibacter sp. ZG627]KIC91863.1 hypothetical protein HY58_06525 [Flavihumibacter sp. ZG627]
MKYIITKVFQYCRLNIIPILLITISILASQVSLSQTITVDGDPSDWPAVLKSNAAHIIAKTFRHDPVNVNHIDDSWAQGSADQNLVGNWKWVFGNSNDKGDIANAGAVLIGKRIYFFGDRTAVNGDAQIGFWFFHGGIAPTGNGANPGTGFVGQNVDGDILAISNFTNGGGTAKPTIYERQGTILVINTAIDALVATNKNKAKQFVPAGVNAGDAGWPFTESWTFTPKSGGTAGEYPDPLFFEGYIDFTNEPDASLCFNRFLLETRNSQSLTASLQDLVAGEFNVIPNPPTVVGDEECFGEDIVLTASCSESAGTTPRWFTAATGGTQLTVADGLSADGTTLTKSGLTAGTHKYYVECHNSTLNCTSTRTEVIGIVNPLPAVDALATENAAVKKISDDIYELNLAKDNKANLTATPAGGTPGYSFEWTEISPDDATSFSYNATTGAALFTVTDVGNLDISYSFKVVVTDSKGCVAEDIVEIRPVASEPICNITGKNPVCVNTTGLKYTYTDPLDLTEPYAPIPENTDFTYDWSITGNGTITTEVVTGSEIYAIVSSTGAGSFTLTLTITNKAPGIIPVKSCEYRVTVRDVFVSLDMTPVSCYGDGDGTIIADFSGGSGLYEASINGSAFSAVTDPYTFTGLVSGNYTITVRDANDIGCTKSANIFVSQPPQLTCNMVAPATNAPCGSSGNTVTGTVSGGTSPYSCTADFDAVGDNAGWIVTSCVVSGTGIIVTYTAGTAVSTVLTVTITDDNGCTTTCTVTLNCTGGHGCTPGYWQGRNNGLLTWDSPTDPIAQAAGFYSGTSFFGFFGITTADDRCGLSASLTMGEAITTGGDNCNKLARHGVAALLNAASLADYPLPDGITSYAQLKTAIANAFINGCQCAALADVLAANNELDHGDCGTITRSLIVAAPAIGSDASGNSAIRDANAIRAFPNPYGNEINFRVISPVSGNASLELFDMLGRRVAVIYNGRVQSGVLQTLQYKVPATQRSALIYKLSIGNESWKGTLLPGK